MEGQIELEDYLRSLNKNNFDILDYIPVGRKKAVKRNELKRMTGINDRYIRLAISHARRKMPILNMQKGDGYFIPDMNDPEDVRLLVKYVRQEESRLKSIGWSLKAARQTLKNCGIDWRYESREYEISGKESG